MRPRSATAFCTEKSKRLYQRTSGLLVEGGSSNSRGGWLTYGDYPIFMQRGQGSRLYDVDVA